MIILINKELKKEAMVAINKDSLLSRVPKENWVYLPSDELNGKTLFLLGSFNSKSDESKAKNMFLEIGNEREIKERIKRTESPLEKLYKDSEREGALMIINAPIAVTSAPRVAKNLKGGMMTKEEFWITYNSKELCETYSKSFDKWWDAELFDWNYSDALSEYCNDKFDKWWDAEKFDWRKSWALAAYCSEHFDKWWDVNKYKWNYTGNSKNCHTIPFKHFWQDTTYDQNFTCWLAEFCSDHFDKWWDAAKFDWKYGSMYLAEHCTEHFDKWWDPEKFNWGDACCLAMFCADHFKKWWDPEKYSWGVAHFLEEECLLKFTDTQLKQLLLHSHPNAREFAMNELRRRKDAVDKR